MPDNSAKMTLRRLHAFNRRRRDFLAGYVACGGTLADACVAFKDYAKSVVVKEKLLDG